MDQIKVAKQVTDFLIDEGVASTLYEAEALADRMYSEAALVTHPEGNLRYGAFILEVTEDGITHVMVESHDWCRDCLGTSVQKVYDEELGVTQVPCQSCKGVTHDWSDEVSTRSAEDHHQRRAVLR